MSKQLILGDVQHELANTRRMLERVPDEHLAWKPHDKSYSLGELATHLTNLLSWQIAIGRSTEFDMASNPPRREALPSAEAILDEFDENQAVLLELLDGLGEEELAEEWTFRHGERVMFTQPRALALRTFGISHMIHHRAQMGLYLRLLDVPVPGMFGPSADEAQA